MGHSHFAKTSKYSLALSASKNQFSNPWIIDSRALDYMINSSKVLVIMAGQGDVFLTSSLTLRNVLHVPKLSINLLFIPQITKDPNCSIKFTQTECFFRTFLWGK